MVDLDFYFGMLDELVATSPNRSGLDAESVHHHTTSRLFGEAVQFINDNSPLLETMKQKRKLTDAQLGALFIQQRNRVRIFKSKAKGESQLFVQASDKYSHVVLNPALGGLYGEWK